MQTYILRRLIQTFIVIILVTFSVFIVMRFLPGDPILLYLTEDEFSELQVTPEMIEALRHEFGLDRPLMVQYFAWISGLFRGDLGVSILKDTTVAYEISQALPRTMYLGIIAFILSIAIGIPAGIICAVRREIGRAHV